MIYDVAIIGGGVTGCAVARELSRYRLRIVIVEKHAEVGFGTSKTNSGIIHSGHHSPPTTLKGRLVVRGNEMFDTLCQDLNFGFRRIGELLVAAAEAEIPELQRLKEQGDAKGVRGLEIWPRERLLKEEPNLSHTLVAALFAPSAGVVNPYELTFALCENAVANGVELKVNSPVIKISAEDDVLVLHTPAERIAARFVVNCAGVFADKIAGMLGLNDFTIRPRKGEEYLLDKRLKGLVRRLIFPVPRPNSKGVLIIPTFDGTIMVGPTAEDVDDRDDLATSYRGSEVVFGFVRRICPAIDARDTITEFAGLRAVSDTNDFIIGPTRVKGFINVAGIQSPGLTSAPSIAEYVRDILVAEGLACREKDDFNPHRPGLPHFALLSDDEQRALVKENPLFAKVVCRCELVTEAEVRLAIGHGAQTLDGIKFRSRAGMGRCQGGFCTTRLMDILAGETGRELDEVTKRGGDSWIVRKMDET